MTTTMNLGKRFRERCIDVTKRAVIALFEFLVDCTAHFVAAVLRHESVKRAAAGTIVAGMNNFMDQPDLDQRLVEMNERMQKHQGELAREAGENFPKVVGSFLHGMISPRRGEQRSVISTTPTTTADIADATTTDVNAKKEKNENEKHNETSKNSTSRQQSATSAAAASESRNNNNSNSMSSSLTSWPFMPIMPPPPPRVASSEKHDDNDEQDHSGPCTVPRLKEGKLNDDNASTATTAGAAVHSLSLLRQRRQPKR